MRSIKRNRPLSRLGIAGAWLILGIVTCLELGLPVVLADIRLPKVFSNSMVLQRQAEVHLYGVADPNEALVFAISGQSVEVKEIKTVCNEQGEFSFRFMAPPVGGPYELRLSGEKSQVLLRDVMVGDVWLCAGQSNMEWPIKKADPTEATFAEVDRPMLRLLTVPQTASPQPLNDFTGVVAWTQSTPQSAPEFSAVAWHFGSRLEQELQVPIGLIHASWGGSKAEAWISNAGLLSEPGLEPLVEFGTSIGDAAKPQDRLSSLYNGMLTPLRGFPIKGVVWYQGEANVGRGDQYRVLMPTLIRDWRSMFQSPQLPFLFVQLAPYRYRSHAPQALPEIWDAQLATFKSIPRTGMVVISDLGNFEDIHPQKKRDVGLRLSDWALAEVYRAQQLLPPTAVEIPLEANSNGAESKTISSKNNVPKQDEDASDAPAQGAQGPGTVPIYSGPIFRSARVDGAKVIVDFYAADGLKSSDGEPLREFQLAGDDQVFFPATCVIDQQQVVVTCPDVPNPVAVRFAWHDRPTANLVNRAGLPASPFRSDNFPLLSAGKHH